MKFLKLALSALFLSALLSPGAYAASSSRTKFATCAHSWSAYKAANPGTKYRAYMSSCLKAAPTPTPDPVPVPAPSRKR